ncbi:MAG: hypothetical protein ACW98K_14860 [Candidatus Kariarchaeaceae archaeon]|jgi:hypothetical protein
MRKYSKVISIIVLVVILSNTSISSAAVDSSKIGVSNGDTFSFKISRYSLPDDSLSQYYTNTTGLTGKLGDIINVTIDNISLLSEDRINVTYQKGDHIEKNFVELDTFGDLIVFTDWDYWENKKIWFYDDEWYTDDYVDITNDDKIFEIKITDEYICDGCFEDPDAAEKFSFKLSATHKSHAKVSYEVLLANTEYSEPSKFDIIPAILGISIIAIIIIKIISTKHQDVEKISEPEIDDPDIQAELDKIDRKFA